VRINKVWAIAETAGAFLPPDVVVIRQNLSFRKQFFFAETSEA
jgi:hypothetical protein